MADAMATLGMELDQAVAAYTVAAAAHRANPGDDECQSAIAIAALDAFEVASRIAAMPAATIPDLRIKAQALAQLFDAVPDSRPSGAEQRQLCQQIIEGLLAMG
jgi:hypothetical protein